MASCQFLVYCKETEALVVGVEAPQLHHLALALSVLRALQGVAGRFDCPVLPRRLGDSRSHGHLSKWFGSAQMLVVAARIMRDQLS